MNIRLEDIAKELDVSIATISRALNKNTEQLVKQSTRNRIVDYVKKIGYKPNIRARGLAKGKMTNLFFILSQNEESIFYDQYYYHIIKGINTILGDTEYSLVPLPIKNDYSRDQIYDIILNNETAGLILSPYCSYIEFPFEEIKGYDFPIICLDVELHEDQKSEYIYNIVLDHRRAGYIGARALWEKGYRNIALISDIRHSRHSELRKSGFYDFFRDKDPNEYTITPMEFIMSNNSGESAIEKVLRIGEFPIGIFSLNDEIAVGMINNLHTRSLKCPQDIGILGFDGLMIGRYTNPRLSSVAFSFKELGRVTAQIFLDLLNRERVDRELMVKPTIIEGESL